MKQQMANQQEKPKEEPQPSLKDPAEETHAEGKKPTRLPAELRHFPPPDRMPDSSIITSPAVSDKAGWWCLICVVG